MYKGANDNAQNAARRLKLADLCTRSFEPTDEERRDSMRRRLTQIEAQLTAMHPKDKRRAELGQEKFQLQEQIRAIRPRWKYPDLSDCLLKVIKSEVTKHQWAMWLRMAEEWQKEAETIADEANRENC